MEHPFKKANTLKYLVNKWVIAIILTIPILFFIPIPKKYKPSVEIAEENTVGEKSFYDDLNDDGNSEKIVIRAYTKLKNVPSIFVEENGKFLYEWITSGYIPQYKSSVSGDYNHDHLKEVYLITYAHDSVFLNGVVPFNKEVLINRKFLSCFSLYHGNNELNISDLLMTDLTGDGFQELVVFIYSGFAYTNRKVIAYDIRNDSLIFSSKSGWGILWNLNLYDWDQDGLPEFTGSFPAWGNCTEPDYPYTDSIAWLMVYDNDLSYLFDPVPVGRYSSEIDLVPFRYTNTASLALLYKQNGVHDSSFIALYTPVGDLIKKKYIHVTGQEKIFLFSDPYRNYRELYLLGSEVWQLDTSLHMTKKINLPYAFPVTLLDVDGDGIKEYIVRNKIKRRWVIYRTGFKDPAEIDIPLSTGPAWFSVVKSKTTPPRLFLCTTPDNYIISYSRNFLYLLRWLVYPLIFLSLWLLVFIIARMQHALIKNRYDQEKRLVELQIKAVKNQIDPHFTLNMVNTIGSLFSRKESERANEVFTRYARMLQSTISSSDNVSTTLHDELEYVRNYLAIQQFRMENKFAFNIRISKEILTKKIKIPKMLVYTFAENAVKHGIRPLKEKGEIDIEVWEKKKTIIIKIADNGVGRKQAKEHPALSTGKGLKILDEIIELFYKLENIRIHYDLNDGETGGTVATVYIRQK